MFVGQRVISDMEQLLGAIPRDLLDPKALLGALFYGVLFIGLAGVIAGVIRRIARRIEPRLSDITGLRFVSAFAELLAYLVGFILYAHLIPELRAL
jgi:predicted membrane channel-forming protein YqfA (hemolysin III family)